MSKYICKRCNYSTNYKGSIRNHFNRKVICEALNIDISVEELLIELEEKKDITICTNCGKKFANRHNKCRHEKACKDINEDNEIIELKNQMAEMAKILEKLIEKKQQNITINNITNNDNSINNINIILDNLRPFGKENYDYIDDNTIKKILKPSRLILYKFVKLIHFNINHPENWNYFISNMRDNKANVYNGKKFVIEDKIESLKKLIESKKDFLETFIKQIEGLMEIDKDVAIEIMNLFDTADYECDTEDTINKTKELAYNSRSKLEVIKTEMDKRNKEKFKAEIGITD
jgi:hypothetical protein